MNTSLENGTGTGKVLDGVHKISKTLFSEGYSQLKYQGWRTHPKEFSMGVNVPKMEWLKSGITKDSTVWINAGWYTFNKKKKEYKRVGGH